MNDEERLGRLYRAAIKELPAGMPDASAARATASTRQRNRRRTAAAVVAAVVLTVLVVVAPLWRKQAVTTAVPAGGGQSVCPALLPGTSDASADYANLLIWDSRTYIDSAFVDRRKVGTLGQQVTTITCSIAELTADNGNLVAKMPWPDGTATSLPTGTPVFAVDGSAIRCELAVRDGRTVKLFVAVREPGWDPIC